MGTKSQFGGQRGGVQHRVLTVADISGAATAVVRRDGIDRMTVKAVAAELGITSPSLYYHVNGRQALLDMVVTHVVDTQFTEQLHAHPGENWKATLYRVLTQTAVISSTYPGVIPYILGEAIVTPASLKVSGFVIQQIRRGGFSHDQTAHAYAAICALVSGWSSGSPRLVPPKDVDGELGVIFAAVAAMSAEQRLSIPLAALLQGLDAQLSQMQPAAPKQTRTRR